VSSLAARGKLIVVGPDTLSIRLVRFRAQRLGLVRRAKRKYNEGETGGLENNAGIIEGI